MATTKTSTAMAASIPVKDMPSGLLNVGANYAYSGATITASANALVIDLCKVPHGAYITNIRGYVSSGAATCPTDFGIEVTSGTVSLSAFASQATIGTTHVINPLKLPFKVSCPDTQTTRYAKIKAACTPGTATSAIEVAVSVDFCMDEVRGDKSY